MKILSIITLLSTLFFFFIIPLVSAQEPLMSNKVITRVGNPPDTVPVPGKGCDTPPPPDNQLREQIQSQFGINMDGGWSNTQLRSVWDLFCYVSSTRFLELVKGSTVRYSNTSEQINNSTVLVNGSFTGTLLKVIVTHELSHIIRWRTDSYITEVRAAIASEGYVTYYAGHAASCTGSDNFNEDYAEMITYYLNPTATSMTASCGGHGAGPNPYADGVSYREHYNIALNILGPI